MSTLASGTPCPTVCAPVCTSGFTAFALEIRDTGEAALLSDDGVMHEATHRDTTLAAVLAAAATHVDDYAGWEGGAVQVWGLFADGTRTAAPLAAEIMRPSHADA